ncbi:MAG: hypothetical protein EAX90_06060 [Candidatus Heimdallarchaeota archaeon]|nr:hypothetical protein [Candidatus Heimdallarchaeota archaeon]
MKIVFNYPINREALDFLKEKIPDDILIIARVRDEDSLDILPSQDKEIIKECIDADILIGPYITEEILSQAFLSSDVKLKLILIPWTGVERLDFQLIKKFPIKVANSHGNARTVAEHAIALLLTGAKQIIHHDQLLRQGLWSSRFRDKPSIILDGKTVGLLGLGAIGIECSKILKGFNVKIIGCRKNPEKTTDEQKLLVSDIYSIQELPLFLKESDIIINSLPLTETTIDILDKEQFQQMKDGVIIVNVGRAKTINEKALYDALKNGKIFAAGLDPQWETAQRIKIIEGEKKYPSNYPIHEFDNVVLSPHRAADIIGGYEQNHWDDVIENILRIYDGRKPINIIDIEKGY